jgi:predicted nucleic acid-binding protein
VADLLVDTDVLVDHLRGARRLLPAGHRIAYSVITRCELFAGSNTDERLIGALLEPFAELGVDRAIAERAGRLRRGRSIRTPDALIAATALEHGLRLLTRNRRDFETIPGLRLEAPDRP